MFKIENFLQAENIQELLDIITSVIFWAGIVAAPILLIVAGFIFMTAAGSPSRVQTSQKIIFYTVIGLAVLLFAKGLIVVLKAVLGAS